jgi:hypothetical protein
MKALDSSCPGISGRALKELSGRSAFRALLRHYRDVVEDAAAEMRALAHEVAAAGLPVTLRVCRVRLASGALRQRLFWHVHGEARIAPFERVRRCFLRIPAPLHGYLERCHARAQELNAIEAIFRYAASQIEMYLKHGTVKLSGGAPDRRRRRPVTLETR